jgi:regulatory protein
MPLITALEPAPGRAGGSTLHVDGDPVCRVSDDLRLRLHLAVGEEISGSRVREIVLECELADTQETALRYLSYRPRTRKEVLRHLRSKGFGAHAVTVVGRCEQLGYIDDEAYALAFARERIRLRPRGRPRVVSELLARGVDRDTAERAAVSALEEEGVTEYELLRIVARRRALALERLEPAAARRRLTGFLRRRGFEAAAVRAVVEELLSDTDDDAPR